MPQDKSSSAVAKGLKMTKFGSNAATVVEKASNIISSAKNNKDGSGGDRTGDQSIATSNTSGASSCHHHYHHHYPPKHRRTASGQFYHFRSFAYDNFMTRHKIQIQQPEKVSYFPCFVIVLLLNEKLFPLYLNLCTS